MRLSRFSEEQIIGILREQDSGAKTADVCRKCGISEATFYAWKVEFDVMEVSDARRLKQLEAENTRLKKPLADAVLYISVLSEVSTKMVKPAARSNAVSAAQAAHDVSERRTCNILDVDRTSMRDVARRGEDAT